MSTKQVSRMRLKCLIFGWIATMLLGVSDANASILTLYDGSSGVTPAGFTPQQLNFFSVAGGTETYRPAEQATELQTTTVQYAGYSNFTPAGALVNANFPLLDRLAGYQIKFTMNLLEESHNSDSRAGFSLLAVSSDAAAGALASIEIGIQGDRIFSQETGFTTGESAAFDAQSKGYVDYELDVKGSTYSFKADGAQLLTGSLRDYTSWDSGPLPDPYEIPNFIFFGDNTTSAAATIYFKSAHLVQPVPEPDSILILSLCLGGVLLYRVIQGRRPPASCPQISAGSRPLH